MKYIIRTILRIVLLMLLFVIPIGFFITAIVLTGRNIPLSNIGIRNFLTVSKNLLAPTVLAAYLFSTGLAVALTDKMKVHSIILLHIPPLLVGAAIGAVMFSSGQLSAFGHATAGLELGYRTFLKTGVFNRADGSMILLDSEKNGKSLILLYNKDTNALIPMNAGSLRDHIRVDAERGLLSISYKKKTGSYSGRFPFGSFVPETLLTSGGFVRFYTSRLRSLLLGIRGQYAGLTPGERNLYGFFLSLSLLLLLIPLVYAMNDRGWGFFGIIGLFTVLFVLPFFFRVLFHIQDGLGKRALSGGYSFLIPAIAAGGCGILIDILIAIRERRKNPSY
jgi:hypothetical protein